jgi:8-amino-7-oxononanoate synthase
MRDFAARLAELDAAGLLRTLRPAAGRDLTSNDVLGLSRHPRVRAALADALARERHHGAGASRLLGGAVEAWAAVEGEVAAWQGAEASLAFTSGYAANTGLLGALLEPGDLVVSDARNHASLIDGVRLGRAERVVVPHGDVDAADRALTAHPDGARWIVVESLYGMDGDLADLDAWAELALRHDAGLIVDEAHATGLYGPQGQGRAHALRARLGARLVTVHTGGKALGVAGAFVAGARPLVAWLVNRARPFVFSTAAPPHLAAGLSAAIGIVRSDPALRARPLEAAARLRAALPGLDVGESASHVVPLIVGTPERALALADALAARGWEARAIRPPTVAPGTCRVRVVAHADLTDDDVGRLAGDVREAVA